MPKADLGKVTGEQGPEGPVAQGTMMESTYDPNGKAQDVFAYADAAKQEAKEYSAPATHASQHKIGGSDPLKLLDIAFLGQNPITSPTDDTPERWNAFGTGYALYNASGQLTDQPGTYGILISYAYSGDVFQIWNTQPRGATYFRSGNSSGWSDSWRKVYDSENKPTPADIGASAYNHNHSANDIKEGTLSVARGGTGVSSMDALIIQLIGKGAAKIETGSYVGTGQSGTKYPNTIVFTAPPKLVYVYLISSSDVAVMIWYLGSNVLRGQFESMSSTKSNKVTVDGNTFSWCQNSSQSTTDAANYQMNTSGKTYNYLAITGGS